ncbi:MAG: ankyrin repeat domain-containing protein [Gammaproteobacteria bacterium]
MFDSHVQGILQSKLPQQIIEYKLSLFLGSINDKENLGLFTKGVCNGFAFMNFRAEILDQEDKNIARFLSLIMMDENEIKKIGILYKNYIDARAKLIETKGDEKGSPIAAINFAIDAAYKQLSALRQDKVKNVTAIERLEDKIRVMRQEREKLVETVLESTADFKEHLDKLKTAKELYHYIHTLVASHSPQVSVNLQVDGETITQQNFPQIMQLLTSEEEKNASVEQVFQMSLSFARQELIDVLENKLDKNTLLEGDHIRITSGIHIIYVSNKNGQLVLYNPLPMPITPNSIKNLVAAIEQSLFVSSDYLPISINIMRKSSSEKTLRPDHLKLITTLLNARKIKNLDAGNNGFTSIWMAALAGDAATIRLLAEYKADMNKPDDLEGRTPAMIASMHGYADALMALQQCGADLNKPSSDGKTALHWAIISKNYNCIKVLLDHEADFNIQDKGGKFPLDYATKEVKAFISLQLLKKYIENHQWEGNCPLIASKHLTFIKEAETNGAWFVAFNKIITSLLPSTQSPAFFTTKDAALKNYLQLFFSKEGLIQTVRNLLAEENSILLARKKA